MEDLKTRIAKLLELVIEFFQRALRLDFDQPLHLIYSSVGIVLLEVTLFQGKLKPLRGGGEH